MSPGAQDKDGETDEVYPGKYGCSPGLTGEQEGECREAARQQPESQPASPGTEEILENKKNPLALPEVALARPAETSLITITITIIITIAITVTVIFIVPLVVPESSELVPATAEEDDGNAKARAFETEDPAEGE